MEPDPRTVKKPAPTESIALEHVLDQSEKIKENVEKAASDLALVNAALKPEKEVIISVQSIDGDVIAQNQEAERKVMEAASDLRQVNAELAKHVAERISIESELIDTKTKLSEVRNDLLKSQVKEEEARQTALHDAVTGIPNRVFFEQRLDHGLIQAKRYGRGLALLFIDLDQFKSINDSYGHDLGDKVLLTVADRLQAFVRGEDTVSRWGGDEFVCLLLDVQQEADVVRLAEQMVDRIAEACEFDGIVLSIRASIGIALYPKDGETADILFKNADRAMYEIKGTDQQVILFHASMLD